MSFSCFVEGSVEAFDSLAFRTNLASAVAVRASAITLSYAAASVLIEATIIAESRSEAAEVEEALRRLQASPTNASTMLGVSIHSISAPLTSLDILAAPSPPPPSPPTPEGFDLAQLFTTDNPAATIGLSGWLALVLVVGICLAVRCRRTRTAAAAAAAAAVAAAAPERVRRTLTEKRLPALGACTTAKDDAVASIVKASIASAADVPRHLYASSPANGSPTTAQFSPTSSFRPIRSSPITAPPPTATSVASAASAASAASVASAASTVPAVPPAPPPSPASSSDLLIGLIGFPQAALASMPSLVHTSLGQAATAAPLGMRGEIALGASALPTSPAHPALASHRAYAPEQFSPQRLPPLIDERLRRGGLELPPRSHAREGSNTLLAPPFAVLGGVPGEVPPLWPSLATDLSDAGGSPLVGLGPLALLEQAMLEDEAADYDGRTDYVDVDYNADGYSEAAMPYDESMLQFRRPVATPRSGGGEEEEVERTDREELLEERSRSESPRREAPPSVRGLSRRSPNAAGRHQLAATCSSRSNPRSARSPPTSPGVLREGVPLRLPPSLDDMMDAYGPGGDEVVSTMSALLGLPLPAVLPPPASLLPASAPGLAHGLSWEASSWTSSCSERGAATPSEPPTPALDDDDLSTWPELGGGLVNVNLSHQDEEFVRVRGGVTPPQCRGSVSQRV